jgi:hypothetical protein
MTNIKDALEQIIARSKIGDDDDEKEIRRQCYHIETIATQALSQLTANPDREKVARLWQELLDKDDRTSPEEYPDMVLITFEEFESAILSTIAPDEAAIRADNTANLLSIIADIREKTGVGGKPMLNELADAIAAEMDRRVKEERESARAFVQQHEGKK